MSIKRAALGLALAVALAPCGFAETAPAHKSAVMAKDTLRIIPEYTRQDYMQGGEFSPVASQPNAPQAMSQFDMPAHFAAAEEHLARQREWGTDL